MGIKKIMPDIPIFGPSLDVIARNAVFRENLSADGRNGTQVFGTKKHLRRFEHDREDALPVFLPESFVGWIKKTFSP